MSELIVITFDDEQQAGRALHSLRGLERQGLLQLNDTAVVVKDRGGSVRTQNEVSSATETGAVVGAVIGGLLAFMFPLLGAALGAAGGAAIGASLDEGVDPSFVREVQESLQPGSSALFIVAREANLDALVPALEPYRGSLRQTTLSTVDRAAANEGLAGSWARPDAPVGPPPGGTEGCRAGGAA
jgi:uncharacterized membrane protein